MRVKTFSANLKKLSRYFFIFCGLCILNYDIYINILIIFVYILYINITFFVNNTMISY